MRNKISEMLLNNEKISLSKIARELDIPIVEVLRESPTVKNMI